MTVGTRTRSLSYVYVCEIRERPVFESSNKFRRDGLRAVGDVTELSPSVLLINKNLLSCLVCAAFIIMWVIRTRQQDHSSVPFLND